MLNSSPVEIKRDKRKSYGIKMNLFFQPIQKTMPVGEKDQISFEDFKDEIFDMVRPADPLCITLQDLINWSVSCLNPLYGNVNE